jgi:hypothetical protein
MADSVRLPQAGNTFTIQIFIRNNLRLKLNGADQTNYSKSSAMDERRSSWLCCFSNRRKSLDYLKLFPRVSARRRSALVHG